MAESMRRERTANCQILLSPPRKCVDVVAFVVENDNDARGLLNLVRQHQCLFFTLDDYGDEHIIVNIYGCLSGNDSFVKIYADEEKIKKAIRKWQDGDIGDVASLLRLLGYRV